MNPTWNQFTMPVETEPLLNKRLHGENIWKSEVMSARIMNLITRQK